MGTMRDMPLTEARRIYKVAFWDFMELDAIGALSPKVAAELFECGVNNGPAIAGMFLQRALNKLNNGGKFYPDLKDTDGVIGP
jgi:lysozyme family protein